MRTATICVLGAAVMSTLTAMPGNASADEAQKAIEQGHVAYDKGDSPNRVAASPATPPRPPSGYFVTLRSENSHTVTASPDWQ